MPKKGAELVDIDVDFVHQTEKAWLLRDGNGKEHWVPKSIGEFEMHGGGGTLTVPTNWALDKGLI